LLLKLILRYHIDYLLQRHNCDFSVASIKEIKKKKKNIKLKNVYPLSSQSLVVTSKLHFKIKIQNFNDLKYSNLFSGKLHCFAS